ncbi:Mechanosensitive ion channel MscS [Dillenia turbinata]|uniref:Mechanosensitive ion channel protein n=1 Tax=Dillenia turbinata TaxID=194707 RepID=A0AAN8WDR6_9MAGN
MDSLRKSLKSHSSYKQLRRISSGSGGDNSLHEQQPILSDHQESEMVRTVDSSGRREVTMKIDGGDSERTSSSINNNNNNNTSRIWRESRYQFWPSNMEEEKGTEERERKNNGGGGGRDGGEGFYFQREDPPSKLIGQFLNKQRNRGGEVALDLDLEMDELKQDKFVNLQQASPPPAVAELKEVRVSFQEPPLFSQNNGELDENKSSSNSSAEDVSYNPRIRRSQNLTGGGDEGGVIRCTSNASFRMNSGILRAKTTKSRLLDSPQPDENDRRSGRVPRSGQVKSGIMSRVLNNEEEDDPFLDEDLPEEYKKANMNAWTWLQWVSLILIVAALITTLSIPVLRKKRLLQLQLWKWEMLVLVLICGRLVSGWGIRFVVFFIERNFVLRKRVLYFVYGLRKAVQNCLWLGLVLIAWHSMFDNRVERETNGKAPVEYVTKVLVCLLLGTLLWLVKTLMVKVLASSFHVSTYFDRIQESLFNQYVIETLSGPPLIEIQENEEEEKRMMDEVRKLQNAGATVPPDLRATAFPGIRSRQVSFNRSGVIGTGLQKSPQKKSFSGCSGSPKQEEGITIDHLHRLNTKNVSAWNMKRLMNIVRHGVLSTTLDEQILDSRLDDEKAMQIRSEREAKIAGRKIFKNVAMPGSKFIYLEDLMRFMREDEALKTMSLFEGASETKRISKSAFKNWAVNAFRERKALALTLNDTKTAVNKLHRMVNVLVGIIIVVIWLLILGIATSKFFVLISSQLLLVVFIFGNTCKTVFESIIFLFVMHPFDVGDRCEVDGVQMVVEEMNILTTIFLRGDNLKIIFPNSTLATKSIMNYYRSPDMGDAIDFCIHIKTPAEKIALMRQRIINYIENNQEHWYTAPMIVLRDVEELTRLKFSIWLRHKMNHQDIGERWERRALLVDELVKIFRELDIEYRWLPIDINIRSMPNAPPTTSSGLPPAPPPSSSRLPPAWQPSQT